ncbi:hypothetical protein SSPO_010980 [Streptomyces antimycoticus]|uniref:Uncharacterized protein n=1 Tax=Streptomyces antimycoticus TaxID=68175 RepID=A0A499UEM7_9ACTN|nr:hypothetical protein SSPO_010980 [Streptomyces antimycoticus]
MSTTAVADGPADIVAPAFFADLDWDGSPPPEVQPTSAKPNTATAQPKRTASLLTTTSPPDITSSRCVRRDAKR